MVAIKNRANKKFNNNAARMGESPRDVVDVKDVIEAAKKDDQAALRKAIGDSGLTMDMDDAKALLKQEALKNDDVLRGFTKHASSRTAAAVRRGGEAVAESGRATGRRVGRRRDSQFERKAFKRDMKAGGEAPSPEIQPPRPTAGTTPPTPPAGGGGGGTTGTGEPPTTA
jgi:hypothetical protein